MVSSNEKQIIFVLLPITAGGMVSKATHIARLETNTLIGFINYTACYVLVLRAVLNAKI
jgi:hypothetical protein